jgi:hydrogenase maturation protein HypF
MIRNILRQPARITNHVARGIPIAGPTLAAAIKRPYRTATGYLIKLLGDDALNPKLAFLKQVDTIEIELIKRQLQTGLNSPLNSSMGRLFDAVSALIGIRGEIDYEGQAAVELEMAAYDSADKVGDKSYSYSIIESNGVNVIQLKELFTAIVEDLFQGVSKATISAKFHNTVAHMIFDMCQLMAQNTAIKQVALTGGVFQNRLLLRKIMPLLESVGFSVLIHKQVPCNDGGISLGQAVIANFS